MYVCMYNASSTSSLHFRRMENIRLNRYFQQDKYRSRLKTKENTPFLRNSILLAGLTVNAVPRRSTECQIFKAMNVLQVEITTMEVFEETIPRLKDILNIFVLSLILFVVCKGYCRDDLVGVSRDTSFSNLKNRK